MHEFEVTVTITLVYTTIATSADMAEHEARTMDDAEIWAVANQVEHDYKIDKVE
jgi:hypothetical protein